MNEPHHFGSGEADDAVLRRLRLLERILDPVTTRHLETTGVAEGWKCLEIGAGAGSVAQWLSKRIGPAGKIVATDINTRFLREMQIPNLEIRRHDIVEDSLETDRYDLVHCRTVLMWVPDPEKALDRMADAVRPGGWLMIEETDYGSILSADATNPSAALVTTTSRTVIDFLRKRRMADPYFGRRVRELLERRGFIDVMNEGWTRICRGGEPMARFDAAVIQMVEKPMIGAGLLTQQQVDSVQRLLMDHAFFYPGLTMFSAWGRKPEER
jgi:SAM-dependent methyltransferase